MVTLGEIKQDYKEVTDLMANYTFSLESIKELNDHLHRIGHETLIEINGEPIDEIKSIKDSEINWVRLDDYNNLSYIYFNAGWQNDAPDGVMFDAFLDVQINNEYVFLEDLKITGLEDAYIHNLNFLAKYASESVKAMVADNVYTPADTLAKLAESTNNLVRESVANNKYTPAEVLGKLALDSNYDVQRKVAGNENTPSDVLTKFADSDEWTIRREVAWNNNTPAEVLERLANDNDDAVRQGVAVNLNTPIEALELLCKDKDVDVKNYAKETVNEVLNNFLYSVKREEFEKAKKYIADYLQSEYSSEADFSNLFHIGIGYTEIGSEEQGDFSFQVEANLVDCEINYYIDGEIAKTEKYDSLAEMNECRLSCLDFEEFLHIGTTELDRILEEKEKAAPVKVVLAVSQYDTNRYYIANNATEAAVRNIISNSDKIFMDLCALGGKQIDEAAFAKYSQTEGITAIDVNIDGQIMNVYDAEKPITTFDDIRSNKIRQSDFINQLDEVIATCQKMKEALINGEVDLDRDQRSVGQER